MDEQKQVPNIVKALAQSVNMTPISWNVPTSLSEPIVIVFEQGPKLTFEREKVTDMIERVREVSEPFEYIEEAVKTENAQKEETPAERKARLKAEREGKKNQ
jgi:hypothetical protein